MASIDKFMVSELQFDLESSDIATRRHALISLSRLPADERLLEIFRQVAEGDSTEELRYLAKKFHGQFREKLGGSTPPEVPAVVVDGKVDAVAFEKLMAHDEKEPRIKAIQELVEAADPSALSLILHQLEEVEDNWVIASLVKAVGSLGDSSNIPVVQAYLKHGDPRVQANAIEALEMIGDELVFPLLTPMLNEKDNRIKANAIKALMKVHQEEAFNVLEKMASSDKLWDRESALYCLSLLEHERVPVIVANMVEEELVADLMKKEAELLAKHGGREQLGLLAYLREESGRDKAIVLKYAVEAISERLGCDPQELASEAAAIREERLARPPSNPADLIEALGSSPTAQDLPGGGRRRSRGPRQSGAVRPVSPPRGREAQEEANPIKALLMNPLVAGLLAFIVVGIVAMSIFRAGGDALPKEPTQVATASGEEGSQDHFASASKGAGEEITFVCSIRFVDKKQSTVLLNHKNRLVLAKFETAPWSDLKNGAQVTVVGELTGKTRFGAVYVKGKSIKIQK